MVNSSAVYQRYENKTDLYVCPHSEERFNTSGRINRPAKEGEFLWTPKEQGVALGAFYYVYCIIQIPGGRLSEIYSAKWVFGLGTFIPVLLSLLTPIAARFHLAAVVILRSMEGLLQGLIFPSMYALISNWFPDCERNSHIGFISSGISLGTVASMTASGFLCNSDLFGGWPSAFYVTGSFGCVWFLLWCFFVTNTPQEHPFITHHELHYITSNQKKSPPGAEVPPFPWSKVLKSVPFWAVTSAFIGGDWGFFVMLNTLPTFFATILHMDIEKNGFFSSLPYLLKSVVFLSGGCVFDYLMKRNILTAKLVRKLSTVLTHIIASIFLAAVCFAGCDADLYTFLFMTFVAVYGFNAFGMSSSPIDLSPEYAGTLMGILNSISSITGFVTPLIIGALTENQQTVSRWQIVFGLSACMQAFTGLIYLIFSSSEKQEWSAPKKKTTFENVDVSAQAYMCHSKNMK